MKNSENSQMWEIKCGGFCTIQQLVAQYIDVRDSIFTVACVK